MAMITMTSKGQITLPASTRARLQLVKGGKLDVEETADGKLVLTPINAVPPKTGSIKNLRGIFKYDGPPKSLEDIDRGIAEAVKERYLRSFE